MRTPVLWLPDTAKLKKQHHSGPLGKYNGDVVHQFREVSFRNCCFRVDNVNDVVYFGTSFGRIVNILKVDDHVVFLVKKFKKVFDVFTYPCASSAMGIAFVSSLGSQLVNVHVREVSKCWIVKWSDEKYYIAKLLHKCC